MVCDVAKGCDETIGEVDSVCDVASGIGYASKQGATWALLYNESRFDIMYWKKTKRKY